jgi:hypothetical protein
MTLNDELDRQLFELGKAVSPKESVAANVTMLAYERTAERTMRLHRRPAATKRRLPNIAAGAIAATIAMVVTGVLLLAWNSSVAFADQAVAALAQCMADGVRVEERNIVVMADGSQHESSTHRVLTVGRESYRRDIYEGEKRQEVQWYTPQDDIEALREPPGAKTSKVDGMLQTSVQFETNSYSTQGHIGGFGSDHPVERLSLIVKFVGKAESRLEPITVKGRQCPGFQIRASQYGDNPPEWIDRIWFDPNTKLPVRVEYERPASDQRLKAILTVQEGFDWHPELSADVFTPKIPDGYKPYKSDKEIE